MHLETHKYNIFHRGSTLRQYLPTFFSNSNTSSAIPASSANLIYNTINTFISEEAKLVTAAYV